MRKRELNNIIYEILYYVLIIISNFIIRKLIVNIIGIELIGLNNILNQIINFISLFELGISFVIMSKLYKPLNDNDIEKIVQIMKAFKKIYIKISIIILLIGILIIPFLKYFINGYNLTINYYLIYVLMLLQSVLALNLSYKTYLIRADQKAYLYLKKWFY